MRKVKIAATSSISLLLVVIIVFLFVPYHHETSDSNELLFFLSFGDSSMSFSIFKSSFNARDFFKKNNQISVNHLCCIDKTHSFEGRRVFSFDNE